ncbi:MAG: amidohydrolase family protein [Candidatus Poribacteria bacterium]|mgnify:CR=1 FL=1
MIIDCHCHAIKGDEMTNPWNMETYLGKYLKRSAMAGISRTVLFAMFHQDYAVANRQVASIIANNPGRFYGFAFVNSSSDRGRIGKLIEEAVVKYGFCGIKAHRHDSRITREVCDVARDFSLTVLYDIDNEVSVIDFLAVEYPDISFIIPHLGSFLDNMKAQTEIIPRLMQYPNIYTDTSGVRHFNLLLEAVQKAGAEKILFGTDGPWLHPGLELMKIRAIQLQKSDENLILGENFLRLVARTRAKLGNF